MQHRVAFGPSDLSSRTELGYFYHTGGKDNNTSVKGQLRNNRELLSCMHVQEELSGFRVNRKSKEFPRNWEIDYWSCGAYFSFRDL